MTENTEVSQDVTEAPAKSDAEEALREQAAKPEVTEEAKPEDEAKPEKPNRTKAYSQRWAPSSSAPRGSCCCCICPTVEKRSRSTTR